MIAEIRRLAGNALFDKQQCSKMSSEDIDFRAASVFFSSVSSQLTSPEKKSLGLIINHGGKKVLIPLKCCGEVHIEMKSLRVKRRFNRLWRKIPWRHLVPQIRLANCWT